MAVYGIIQVLDGNVLVPLLFSEAVNLHPVAIICAVLLFGMLMRYWLPLRPSTKPDFFETCSDAIASRLAPTSDRVSQNNSVNCGSEPARESVRKDAKNQALFSA